MPRRRFKVLDGPTPSRSTGTTCVVCGRTGGLEYGVVRVSTCPRSGPVGEGASTPSLRPRPRGPSPQPPFSFRSSRPSTGHSPTRTSSPDTVVFPLPCPTLERHGDPRTKLGTSFTLASPRNSTLPLSSHPCHQSKRYVSLVRPLADSPRSHLGSPDTSQTTRLVGTPLCHTPVPSAPKGGRQTEREPFRRDT